MADTYQTKLTVNGRNPGDNTLEVYRTAGTECTELAATYRNQHFWLPTGNNWFTRKWISGEDQDDGFKQCVCVNAALPVEYGNCCVGDQYRVPHEFIGTVANGAGSFSGYGYTYSMSGLNASYVYDQNGGGSTLRCDSDPSDVRCINKRSDGEASGASASRFVTGFVDFVSRRIDDVCNVWLSADIRFQADGGNPELGDTPIARFTYETAKAPVATASDIESFLGQNHNLTLCRSPVEDPLLVPSGDFVAPDLAIRTVVAVT